MQTSSVRGGYAFHINDAEDFCNDSVRMEALTDSIGEVVASIYGERDIYITNCSMQATNRLRRLQDDMQVRVQYTIEFQGADWDELARITEEYVEVLNSTSIDEFDTILSHELSVATNMSIESVGLNVVAKETVEAFMAPKPTPTTDVPTNDTIQETTTPTAAEDEENFDDVAASLGPGAVIFVAMLWNFGLM